MRVIWKGSSWLPWKDLLVLEAPRARYACFETFFGSKLFYVGSGCRVRMSVPKSWYVMEGDEIDLHELVMHNQDKFSWRWA